MDSRSVESLEQEEQATALLSRLAPHLVEAARVSATMGAHKRVFFVGQDYILRIPRDDLVRQRLEIERRVLRRLEGRLCLPTPRVVAVDPETGADLCIKAPGHVIDWRAWGKLGKSGRARLGRSFGRFLADLHAEIPATEALDMGVSEYSLPDGAFLEENLACVMKTSRRKDLLSAVLATLPRLGEHTREPVLLHDDFSHHNIGFELPSMKAVGVFDFGGAQVGDPHRDLRYDPGLEGDERLVVDEYEAAGGQPISRGRQRAWHALSALENLIHSLANEGPELQAARWGWVDSVASWDQTTLEEE